MNTLQAVFLTIGVVLSAGHSAAAQTTPPTERDRTALQYPEAALRAGVEGDVTFNATIGADGTVRAVRVIEVPREHVGFEEAVTAAVMAWHFNPALQDGTPVEGAVVLAVSFKLSLQGDYLFQSTPHEAWEAVKVLVKALHFSAARIDETHQVLVTKPLRYSTKLLPDARALGFSEAIAPTSLTWYVSVSPDFENARVSIGSVLEVRRGVDFYTVYRNAALEAWLRDRLGKGLGRPAEALSVRSEQRAKQSPIVRPSGGTSDCTPWIGDPLSLAEVKARGGTAPLALVQLTPVFPKQELNDRHEGAVTLAGDVLEHGSLTNVRLIQPQAPSPGFVTASLGAATLWRFSTVRVDGCPAPVSVTIEMHYKLR